MFSLIWGICCVNIRWLVCSMIPGTIGKLPKQIRIWTLISIALVRLSQFFVGMLAL